MNSDVMNAIDLLKSQHRTLRRRFADLRAAKSRERRQRVFAELADALAVHAEIGDRQFYPAIMARKHGEALFRPFAGHLDIRNGLAKLLPADVDDEGFDTKLRALRELVEHHVRDEEDRVFPKVKGLLGAVQLTILGREMGMEAGRIESAGAPRRRVTGKTLGIFLW